MPFSPSPSKLGRQPCWVGCFCQSLATIADKKPRVICEVIRWIDSWFFLYMHTLSMHYGPFILPPFANMKISLLPIFSISIIHVGQQSRSVSFYNYFFLVSLDFLLLSPFPVWLKIFHHTGKKGYRFSPLQPGCQLLKPPWPGIRKSFPARGSLVIDIPSRDGKTANLFFTVQLQTV